jgi:hypothetical protein
MISLCFNVRGSLREAEKMPGLNGRDCPFLMIRGGIWMDLIWKLKGKIDIQKWMG